MGATKPRHERWMFHPKHAKYCPFVFSRKPPVGKEFPARAVAFGLASPPSETDFKRPQYRLEDTMLRLNYPKVAALLEHPQRAKTWNALVNDVEQATGLTGYTVNKLNLWVPAARTPRKSLVAVEVEF